ncbi:MAG TPA: ATP-binding protein [Vicinamibacterales bacterium]|jgi:signal transduction histidine kinase/ActR/RegA family two-component response regulator|nr:ATP-binding protein [Vicinamibacterales bacterium]
MKAPEGLGWQAQPRVAQLYVIAVIVAGVASFAALVPLAYPRPITFALLFLTACFTARWKVTLPISLACGSTLSVTHAVNLMALLLLGPRHAVPIAVAGAWAQCTFHVKQRYPPYRTVFSIAAEAFTMMASAVAYDWLGGLPGPVALVASAKPLVGAIATYFVVNTGLIASAIALSTRQSAWAVWRDDFFWSGTSFMVAGTAGAGAAILINRGEQWVAVMMLAPVYVTYRMYRLVAGRLELLERERAARAAAEEANRLKDQFLATVSHELRTPLNAILGWADILRRNGALDDARRDRGYQAIYDSARRQARLIDELLDVARIMSGKLELEPTSVDVRAIVRSALEVVQPLADKNRVQVSVQGEASSGVIRGDGARLQQILWNLLTNAVKFTPAGGRVHVALVRTATMLEISVTDTGCGIPREFLPFVFEPFRQADGSTTRRHGGLGLGLSIVKHLVDAHGGTVSVESGGDGRGATFTVRLPVVAVSAAPAEPPADPLAPPDDSDRAPATGTSLHGISVLVVDDDEESRDIVAEYLQGHQAIVRTAISAGQAFDVLQRERVDVLLADIAMPDEDGYALIRKVRACTTSALGSIPAAALTAFARDEDRQRALQAGFHLHLAKPIDPKSLVDAVASLGKLNATT